PGDLAFLDHGRAADDLVVHVDAVPAVLRLAQLFAQAQQVGGIERARLLGEAAGEIGIADDRDAVPYHASPRLGELAVAALLRGEIHDHAAGAHRAHHVGAD